MKVAELILRGVLLLGASTLKNYDNNSIEGVALDIGYRSDGKFQLVRVKVLGASVEDYLSSIDEQVELTLTNVTITSYMSGNRAALSVKAGAAVITA
ncbi:Uncharacterised protein [Streptococcus sanguinis]|uniref:Uncharacterized protein n=1 Tax=Streptococcus sanguinis TaxID=1305 RepID=A0A2X3Y578_STRSA|nr:Uncharacterised protein [Streptococcus sanguinis]